MIRYCADDGKRTWTDISTRGSIYNCTVPFFIPLSVLWLLDSWCTIKRRWYEMYNLCLAGGGHGIGRMLFHMVFDRATDRQADPRREEDRGWMVNRILIRVFIRHDMYYIKKIRLMMVPRPTQQPPLLPLPLTSERGMAWWFMATKTRLLHSISALIALSFLQNWIYNHFIRC